MQHTLPIHLKLLLTLTITTSLTNSLTTSPTTAFTTPTPLSEPRIFISTPAAKPPRPISSCMTPLSSLLTLTPSTTVDEAVNLLLSHSVSGAPVLDPTSGSIVGIVSSSDFLQREAGDGILLPLGSGGQSREEVEGYVEVAGRVCAKRVGDLMTRDPVCLGEGRSIRDAAVLMAREKLHRILVVDEDEGGDGVGERRLVGMLTSTDVMKDMVRVVQNLPSGDDASGGDPVADV